MTDRKRAAKKIEQEAQKARGKTSKQWYHRVIGRSFQMDLTQDAKFKRVPKISDYDR